MSQTEPNASQQASKIFNITLTTVIAQVGCLTPVIIVGALFLGLWLDRVFASKTLFTIIFILGSMPVSIVALLVIVRSALKRLKSETKQNPENSSEGGL